MTTLNPETLNDFFGDALEASDLIIHPDYDRVEARYSPTVVVPSRHVFAEIAAKNGEWQENVPFEIEWTEGEGEAFIQVLDYRREVLENEFYAVSLPDEVTKFYREILEKLCEKAQTLSDISERGEQAEERDDEEDVEALRQEWEEEAADHTIVLYAGEVVLEPVN